MKKIALKKIVALGIIVLSTNFSFAQWTLHEGLRVDLNGIGNGIHSAPWAFPGITFGANIPNASGEAIGSNRQAFTALNQFGRGLDFHTNYMRRFHISNNGLLTVGAVNTSFPNRNANLEVQATPYNATTANVAFRVFPFVGTFNQSVSIQGSTSNKPAIRFNDVANQHEIRGISNGLELGKVGYSNVATLRWGNTPTLVNQAYLEVGAFGSISSSDLDLYRLYVQNGIKTKNILGTNATINATTAGTSGLKFGSLNSNSATQMANGKSLSVDANGNVILVPQSAGGPTYTAGTGISINALNVISSEWDSNPNEVFNLPNKSVLINSPFGTSGLKFANINALGPISPLSNMVCLSVDMNGEVILVPYPTPGGGGGNWAVNGSHIYNSNSGNVGIGLPNPSAKLDLYSSSSQITAQFINKKSATSWTNSTVGLIATADQSPGLGTGAYFVGSNTGSGHTAEADLDLLNSSQAGSAIFDLKGVDAYSNDIGTTDTRWSYGVKSQAFSSSPNANAVALYGYAINSANSSNQWAVYADGDAYTTGSGLWQTSDARLKTNIEKVNNALDIVQQLEAKSYEFRHDGKFANTTLSKGTNYGFLAQELEKVLPEAVGESKIIFHDKDKSKETSETYKSVNYIALIPILTQAIKEQQEQINDLKSMLTNSKKESIELANNEIQTSTLSQNTPNPFTSDTRINFQIMQSYKNAKIGVYDLNGKELKLFNLQSTNGEIIIQGRDLKPGMYIYSLIIDGVAIDSKKMILTSN